MNKSVTIAPEIYKVLYRCGVPSNVSGCDCLATAVAFVLEQPDLRHGVCRGLYPKVASVFGISVIRCERRMRYAIMTGFNRSTEINKEIFGNSVSYLSGVPSVMHFVTAVANYVRPLYWV